MKILIVSQYFWPESFLVNDLAKDLVKRGHQVDVLTGQPNYPAGSFFASYSFWGPRNQNYEGVNIFRVPLVPRKNSRSLNLIINYLSFVFFACLLGPFILRSKKYDHILVFQLSPITSAIPAILLKKLKKTKLSMWVQDLWPESLEATGAIKSPFILNLVKKLVVYIYKNCDQVFVQSEAFKDKITSTYPKIGPMKYIPNWAPPHFKPIKSVGEKKYKDGFNLVFAGNLGEAQGFECLLEAAEKSLPHKDIHWNIIGDGRKRPWIEKTIKEKNLSNITMHGRHPIESMPEFFAQADLLLVSLSKDPIFEITIPFKTQTYMACAKPILASLDGEGARVINLSNSGLASPCDDSEQLYKNLIQLHKMSKEELNQLGQNAYNYFLENFEQKLVIDRLEKSINEQ